MPILLEGDDGQTPLWETLDMLHRTEQQLQRFATGLAAAHTRLMIAASAFAVQPRAEQPPAP
jgi:hypothetical protein